MKKLAALSLSLFIASFALAQDATDKQLTKTSTTTEEKTPLDTFKLEGGYTFQSEITDDDSDAKFGKGDAFELEFEYAHRFHLSGHWYLRTGVNYNRFTFGDTRAPIPDHLHSLAAIIAIDYMVGADQGMFAEIRPGFYGEDQFNMDSFDCPITLIRAWVLKQDKVYLLTGVNVAFLRGRLPVLPLAGIVWRINDDRWILYAVPPEPRLIFMPNKQLDFWAGGQITGNSFRVDDDPNILPRKLSGAQIDYVDYRAGLGMSWHPNDAIEFNVGGGISIQRQFDYDRADVQFDSDPAPYVRAWIKAEF